MDVSNSSTLQNILVWSYLGRHFTSTRQQQVQDDLYFEFNIATCSMTLRKVQCELGYESVIGRPVLRVQHRNVQHESQHAREEYKNLDGRNVVLAGRAQPFICVTGTLAGAIGQTFCVVFGAFEMLTLTADGFVVSALRCRQPQLYMVYGLVSWVCLRSRVAV